MPSYAWKVGSWKKDLWRLGAWGANPQDSAPPTPGLPTISGGASGQKFATLSGEGIGGARRNKTLTVFGLKRRS